MSMSHLPQIPTTGLQLYLDATNTKSYSGSGTTWNDMSIYRNVFATSYYTYPSIAATGNLKYFTFVNNGTTVNNIYSASPTISTYAQTQYTRIGWFNLSGNNGWSPIIQNQIGNNSDMGLTVAGNRIHFRQYTRTATSGTTDSDYGVSGSTVINLNTWYQGVIVVDRVASTLKIYVNGVLDTATSLTTIGNSASDIMLIGGAATDSYAGDRMFKGSIAAVCHYNRLLTPDEIQQNFNALRGRFGI